MNTNKRIRLIVVVVITLSILLFVLGKALVDNDAKDLSKALQSIPNESLLKLSKILDTESEKKQNELLSKFAKANQNFLETSNKRLAKLEELNRELINEIHHLKYQNMNPNLSLREKLIGLVPYDGSKKFPAYIWQSWKYGLNDEKFDSKFKDGEAQWAYKNPGFVHELFNDDTAFAIIKHLYIGIQDIVSAYELLPEVTLKMDFFRYLILFAKGGVWADIDTFPLQPVPNWIPENVDAGELGLIIGIEVDSNSANWKSEQSYRLQFGQFIIQAKPGHPILREVIAQITEKTLKLRSTKEEVPEELKLIGSSNQKYLKILNWTGSGIWTEVIFKFFNNYIESSIYQQITWKDFRGLKVPKLVSDVLVLPISSFASEIPLPEDGKIEDALAFAKHSASQLWKVS